jgi:hypothetical protein
VHVPCATKVTVPAEVTVQTEPVDEVNVGNRPELADA